MRKRIVRLALMVATLATALYTTTACGGEPTGPKTGVKFVTQESGVAQQLDHLRSQDPSLQRLQQEQYTPVAVIYNGYLRMVSYRLCGKTTLESCHKGQPDATHPVIYVFTTTVGLDDPIIFNGDFRLMYGTPHNLSPALGIDANAYRLYCRIRPSLTSASASPVPTVSAAPTTAMPVDIVGQFANIGSYFGALEYSRMEGKTFTHTRNENGSWRECTAHYEFM